MHRADLGTPKIGLDFLWWSQKGIVAKLEKGKKTVTVFRKLFKMEFVRHY